jgi:hypothetical protein
MSTKILSLSVLDNGAFLLERPNNGNPPKVNGIENIAVDLIKSLLLIPDFFIFYII